MLKDQKLDEFAQRGVNIAQFVSYGPDGKKRYSRIRETDPTHQFASIEQAIQAILNTGAPYVNIRSFTPNKPDGNPLFMGRKEGWTSVVVPAELVRALIRKGYHVIINEDININDGGFSGVVMGEIAEFAPSDTPRCVEKTSEPRCAVLPRSILYKLVHAVYGRRIGFPYSRNHRIEFSVHPGPVGYLRQSEVMWQEEKIERGTGPGATPPTWPNRYSQAMGDKAYGLLMAFLHGLPVPHTRVTGRLIPPFEFGELTNDIRKWIRTCPRNQTPGKFTTEAMWIDPFALMQREDPDGSQIASIIEQANVSTEGRGYSGAAITDAGGQVVIEGNLGKGDAFMLGTEGAGVLPVHVTDAVTALWEEARQLFGPVRFEWVYDRHNTLWLVQLHCGKSASVGTTIYPGEATTWVHYDVTKGLEGLRELISQIQRQTPFFDIKRTGIVLQGNVGITSHFGDLLRRAKIHSRLERTLVQA